MSAERPSCRTRNGLKTASEIRTEERNSPHAQNPQPNPPDPDRRRSRGFSCSSGQLFLFRERERSASCLERALYRSSGPQAGLLVQRPRKKKRRRGRTWVGEGRMSPDGPRDPSSTARKRSGPSFRNAARAKGGTQALAPGTEVKEGGRGDLAKVVLGSCALPFRLFWEVILGRTEGRREPPRKCRQGCSVFPVKGLEGTGKGAAKRTARFPP